MKTKMMMFAGVLCLFMLTGLKKSVAQDVQVGIYLPYSGNYNEWDITLINDITGETYEFHTNSTTFNTQILGTVPAGHYNIDYQSIYFPTGFDFGVTSTDYYHYQIHRSAFRWFTAPIDETTFLIIDEGY